MATTDKLLWIDTETFGLEPQTCQLIEVAIVTTTLDLEAIDHTTLTIWGPEHETQYDAHRDGDPDGFVFKTHTKSGLFDEARRHGMLMEEAERKLLGYLIRNQVDDKPPMCGSTVSFDRGFLNVYMPELVRYFGYRNIDISSIKELVNRYAPEVMAERDAAWSKENAKHRALDDCYDSIEEYAVYHRHLFGRRRLHG